jgi:hypothetical protein
VLLVAAPWDRLLGMTRRCCTEIARKGPAEPQPPRSRLALFAGILALSACTTYRAYSGDKRPAPEVAILECDLQGVSVRRVDRYVMSGWSEFELLAGPHEVSAELYWTRLEKLVEGPEKAAKFVAKAGKKYRCVFDVDETKPDWALAIVADEKVSWKSRTFHGARSWRTPDGNCVLFDQSVKACLGDVAREGDPDTGDRSASQSDAIAP